LLLVSLYSSTQHSKCDHEIVVFLYLETMKEMLDCWTQHIENRVGIEM